MADLYFLNRTGCIANNVAGHAVALHEADGDSKIYSFGGIKNNELVTAIIKTNFRYCMWRMWQDCSTIINATQQLKRTQFFLRA